MARYKKYKRRFTRKRKRRFRPRRTGVASKGFVRKTIKNVLKKQTEMKYDEYSDTIATTTAYVPHGMSFAPIPTLGDKGNQRTGAYITVWRMQLNFSLILGNTSTADQERLYKWWIVYHKELPSSDDYPYLCQNNASATPTNGVQFSRAMEDIRGQPVKILMRGQGYLTRLPTNPKIRGPQYVSVKRTLKFRKGLKVEFAPDADTHREKFFRLVVCSGGTAAGDDCVYATYHCRMWYTDA